MSQIPRIISEQELPASEAKWVTLKKITFTDETGKERLWEAAERKTRSKGGIDAVAIMAILQPKKDLPPATVIIEQYRPPVNSFVIGLIDEGESPETTAIRELREETGFEADAVIDSSDLMVSDPGMSSTNMKLVTLRVPVEDYDTLPKQVLEPGEFIKPVVVELDKLYDKLQGLNSTLIVMQNYVVDARLSHLAIGYKLNSHIAANKGIVGTNL
ncbi:hypothetical protein M422DRAFT_32948 [Sphaerobolus stellatus SS14]|uniref:Nudix hydrolase domain-containing protein n=1 Tax=Sphaerobolus stellatus (strain SS14) TaxID=990650 RepID=A0A0C9UVK8_SPHS4|nr:hypothetical protein M422DRAFT_32948 [Sphaerobolus stellatus SS14]